MELITFFGIDYFAEIKETFTMFDKSGDGTIPLDTIGDAFRALGQAPTNAEIQTMMDKCQCNGKSVKVG